MNILYNGQPRQIHQGATVALLLKQMELPPARVAVEVNLQLVPRAEHAEHVLREGDALEVVTLAGGG